MICPSETFLIKVVIEISRLAWAMQLIFALILESDYA
jgi:hypothetical protein